MDVIDSSIANLSGPSIRAALGGSLSSWMLAPSLLLTGFGTGLVFVPIFDFILGAATTEEGGTGSGMLNAVQQFAPADARPASRRLITKER
jgi:hypothetical protein